MLNYPFVLKLIKKCRTVPASLQAHRLTNSLNLSFEIVSKTAKRIFYSNAVFTPDLRKQNSKVVHSARASFALTNAVLFETCFGT